MLFEQMMKRLHNAQRARDEATGVIRQQIKEKKMESQQRDKQRAEPGADFRTCGVPIPIDLHAALKARAKENGTSIKIEALRAIKRDFYNTSSAD